MDIQDRKIRWRSIREFHLYEMTSGTYMIGAIIKGQGTRISEIWFGCNARKCDRLLARLEQARQQGGRGFDFDKVVDELGFYDEEEKEAMAALKRGETPHEQDTTGIELSEMRVLCSCCSAAQDRARQLTKAIVGDAPVDPEAN
jgi:hypothetical protein